MGSRVERLAPLLGAAVLAALLALLLYDSTFLTTDAIVALAWGGELLRGGSPDVTAPLLPVFHPLPTALGAALEPLGPDAIIDGYRVLAMVALGALAYSAYRLGVCLQGPAAGLVATALLLTRPEIVEFGRSATIDIPFTALALLAAALVLERPLGNRWWVLALLALAGLLRPEAWVLALAYGGWLALRTSGAARAWIVVAALTAPLIWALSDLALTGEPLATAGEARADFSRQLLAAGYEADVGAGEERTLGHYLDPLEALGDLLGWPLALGGLAAALAALLMLRGADPRALRSRVLGGPSDPEPELGPEARSALLALFALLALGAVLGLRALDFPFSIRFVVLPASALAVLFAAALARYRPPPAYRATLLAAAAAIALTLPADIGAISDSRRLGRVAAEQWASLRELTGSSRVRAAVSECDELGAGGELLVVLGVGAAALEFDRDPAEIPVSRAPGPELPSLLLLRPEAGVGAGGEPPDRALIERRGPWELWSRCGGRP